MAPHHSLPNWVAPDCYPFESRFYDHAEGVMHYADEGSGPTLLFVHGTPSWSFEWRAAMLELRETHRCIAVDHLGFGLSDKPHGASYLPRDHTRRLHDFVRALNLADVTLVVHDFGGPIALPLLAREPQRFRSVVATNTWAWPVNSDVAARRLSSFVRSPLGKFLYMWCNASPRWLLPAAFAKKGRLSPLAHRHYTAPFQRRAERIAPWTLGSHLADDAAYDPSLLHLADLLRTLPLTVIWAQQDALLGLAPLRRWRELCPDAHYVDLHDCGHFPLEEQPAEFVALLKRALEALP